MTNTNETNEYAYSQDTEHGIPEDFDRCVACGERPWGFGYCGEECQQCAADTI
jgi:hypothetical protein